MIMLDISEPDNLVVQCSFWMEICLYFYVEFDLHKVELILQWFM